VIGIVVEGKIEGLCGRTE